MHFTKNQWTRELLEEFIGHEESSTLEFKSSDGLTQGSPSQVDSFFEALSKHVSAFLNTEGGQLIVGIDESSMKDKIMAERAVRLSKGVRRSIFTGVRFSNKLCDRIHPSVGAYINVIPVKVGKIEDDDLLAFVIEVKPGITAYQAADKRYYSRNSFSSEPLDDKDVRLRMLADNTPRAKLIFIEELFPENTSWEQYRKEFDMHVQAKCELERRERKDPQLTPDEIAEKFASGEMKFDVKSGVFPPRRVTAGRLLLNLSLLNFGLVTIKKACIQFELPPSIDKSVVLTFASDHKVADRSGDNLLLDIDFQQCNPNVPIYPEMHRYVVSFQIDFPRDYCEVAFDTSLKVTAYLDGGPPSREQIDLHELLLKNSLELQQRALEIENAYPDINLGSV